MESRAVQNVATLPFPSLPQRTVSDFGNCRVHFKELRAKKKLAEASLIPM
jgi:hypothetical protein